MHDLDRPLRTAEPELDEFFDDPGLGVEAAEDEPWPEDFELFAADIDPASGSPSHDGGLLTQAEEWRLAEELLDISDDEELEQFLGKLFKRARRGIRRIGRKARGLGRRFRPLGRLLKPLAKKLLPIAGGAAGTFFGGPAGAALGGRLGSMASRLFEIDIEEMDSEELELEVARRFVRLAADAANEVALADDSGSAEEVARGALSTAARRHAPGLVAGRGKPCSCGGHEDGGAAAGRWERRGQTIVLIGA